MNAKLKKLLKFNYELNLFEYGIPLNGIIQNVTSPDYYAKYFRYLTPEEFKRANGGICWDYVAYQTEFLSKNGYDYTNYFICNPNRIDEEGTHTITVVFIEETNKYYYIESSFKPIIGVYESDNITDIFDFIIQHMRLTYYEIRKYKKCEIYGASCIEYMNWMMDNAKLVRKGKPKMTKVYLKNIQKSQTMPKDTRNSSDMVLESYGMNKNVKYVDLHDPSSKKYLMQDEYIKNNLNHFMEFQNGELIIDVDRDVPVGRICVWNEKNKKNTGFINSLYIDEDYRGNGFGNQLLKDAINNYGGYDLCVHKDNKIALNMYKKYGFVEDASRTKKDMKYMILKNRYNNAIESFINYCDTMSFSDKRFYFLSKENMNGRILQPRIPNNYFTKNGYEDNTTKRICFAPSINQAIMGLSMNCSGLEYYVHILDSECEVYVPTINEVPDSEITGEVWIKRPVRVKCIGKIKILDSVGDGLSFNYGDKTAELYKFKWKWIVSI